MRDNEKVKLVVHSVNKDINVYIIVKVVVLFGLKPYCCSQSILYFSK